MKKQNYFYHAKILSVVDGDTVDVEIDLGFYVVVRERMRLSGIDTAEMTSPFPEMRKLAQDAKAFMNFYIGWNILLKSFKKDKYGRFLAEIFLVDDAESLNQKLINAGLAKEYNGGLRI